MLFIKSFLSFTFYPVYTIFSLLLDCWGMKSHNFADWPYNKFAGGLNRGCFRKRGSSTDIWVLLMPGIHKYLTYIHPQNPCHGWNIPIDRWGNRSSKKLSDLFQDKVGFKPWADSKVQALDNPRCIKPYLAFRGADHLI